MADLNGNDSFRENCKTNLREVTVILAVTSVDEKGNINRIWSNPQVRILFSIQAK